MCAFLVLLFIVSSPSSLSIAPETDATPVIDDPVDEPSLAAELPGKQTPLEHFRYRPCLFSLILALELPLLLLLLSLLHSLLL